jgi:hypothetical protein
VQALQQALERTKDYIQKAIRSSAYASLSHAYDRGQVAGLQHALNAINAEFAAALTIPGEAAQETQK